jgi:3-hydroxy-9,10-secoandrosta-1,3,5(10)-triene-9,17-dione monooxygenase
MHALADDTLAATSLVKQATDLAPRLAAKAAATIAARRVPADNIALLRSIGVNRVLQPRDSGGFEQSLHTHIDVVSAVAQGCGSTGWCLGVYHAHEWLMGLYGPQARADVYGKDADTLISAVIAPRGKAVRTADGYRVSGFWPFCSGVHNAAWVMLGAHVEDPAASGPDSGIFLIPASEIEIKDDWYVAGLSGTGSNSVVAKDVLVPAHRFLSIPKAIEGSFPGRETATGDLYHAAPVPVLTLFLCGPAIGIARRALEHFRKRLPGRVIAYTFDQPQIESAVTHAQVGEAATKIDTANLLLHAMVDEVESHAQARTQMPFDRRSKARADCAFAVRLCLEAVELLIYASGGSGLAENNEVQMAARDIRAINMHGLLNWSTNAETYGRTVLGLAPNSPVI